MLRFILIAVLPFLLPALASSEDCDWVKLKSTYSYFLYQDSRVNKKYGRQSYTNDGKAVFKQANDDEYLYWQQSDFSWNFGSVVGSSSVGVYTFSNHSHPADIPSSGHTWYVYTGSYFRTYSYTLSVECTSKALYTWEVALIVIAVIGVIIGLVVLVICLINKSQKKRSQVHNTGSSNRPMYGNTVTYTTQGGHPSAHYGQPPPAYNQAVSGQVAYGGAYGAPPPGYTKTAAGPGIPAQPPRGPPAGLGPQAPPASYGINTQAQPGVYTTTQSGVPLAAHPAPTVSGAPNSSSD